jgi:hypothetical protein
VSKSFKTFLLIGVLLLQPFPSVEARAGEVTVKDAKATQSADGTWRFDVTLAHGDTGWDHYADRWEVLSPAGEVLGTRVLYVDRGHDPGP